MSNTRNNKRKRESDDADEVSEILRRIYEAGDVRDDEINKLFMITKPVCHGCRVNTSDNPNCFCGLAPPVIENRETGLGQIESEVIESLGPDPSLDCRASDSTPAGLTNLGATCYLNAILQCLFMNTTFREGVFSVEDDLLQKDELLNQISRLFAELQASKKSCIDTEDLVNTLDLDRDAQEDTHEFLTMLLDSLKSCFESSKVSKVKTLVQDLFRGSASNVTT